MLTFEDDWAFIRPQAIGSHPMAPVLALHITIMVLQGGFPMREVTEKLHETSDTQLMRDAVTILGGSRNP